MIIVHHLENSRSQRILWLLEELGLPYEVKRYARLPNMLAPPELLAVHPLGKSPVITDGDVTVAETGAIVEYLLETYGEGRLIPPAGTAERRRYTYWLHHAEGSAMGPLVMKLVFSRLAPSSPVFIRPLVRAVAKAAERGFFGPQIERSVAFWEQTLAGSTWFAGEAMTGADIMMSFPLEAAAARSDAASRPHIKAFLNRIHARPAYQRALERGGPYTVGR